MSEPEVTEADREKAAVIVPSHCSIPECESSAYCRGWCTTHYTRWRMHGSELWEPPKFVPSVCEADGCDRVHYCQGYCVMHYSRLRAHGDVTVRLTNETPELCTAEGCESPASQGLWCIAHRARLQRLGTLDLPPRSERRTHSMGYQIIKRPDHPATTAANGWVYEHRVVLFDAIGPGWHPCHHCGMQVSWELTYPESPDALVVDHLDEDRANNDPSNLVPSCNACNIARSNRWVKQRREVAS